MPRGTLVAIWALLALWLGAVVLGIVLRAWDWPRDGDAIIITSGSRSSPITVSLTDQLFGDLGREHRPSTRPSSSPFDALFRQAGSLFVFAALSCRVLLTRLLSLGTVGGGASQKETNAPSVAFVAVLYSAHAALRAALYQLHVYLIRTRTIAGHIMSDHVLLSSCVLTGLLCEVYVVLHEAVRHRGRRRVVLYAFGSVLVAVIVGLAMEVFATARFFHDWVDSLVAVGFGGLIFKWPAWRAVRGAG